MWVSAGFLSFAFFLTSSNKSQQERGKKTLYLYLNLFSFSSTADEPEVKAESPAVHAGVGYQVELVCVVYSEPAADVLWYKDTMLLDSNGRRYMQQKGNRHTLLIRTVENEDFGNYSCSASNMLGKARAYIRVQGKDRSKQVLNSISETPSYFQATPTRPCSTAAWTVRAAPATASHGSLRATPPSTSTDCSTESFR
jgi:hypothetical protein